MKTERIIEGPPLEQTIHSSLGELCFTVLQAHNDKILQIDAVTGEEQTGKLILNRAIRLAKWLEVRGVGPGQFVALSSENRLEFVVVLVATLFTGASFTPFNPHYTEAELKHIIGLTKPVAIFFSKTSSKTIFNFVAKLPYIKYAILLGKQRQRANKLMMLKDILRGVTASLNYHEDFSPVTVNTEKSIAFVMYSSGTTGLPKGVMISHSNVTAFVSMISVYNNPMQNMEFMKDMTTIGVPPYFHAMGFYSMFLNMLIGRKHVVLRKFEPKVFLDALVKYNIQFLTIPPTLWHFLMKHPLTKKYDLSHLKIVAGGGATITADLEQSIKNRFPTLQETSQGYGLTETVLGAIYAIWDNHKLGSCGKPLPGVKVKVVNEKGEALGPNEEGEICFAGPNVMLGYIGNPEATKAVMDSDGFFHTGDIGYYDDEGYFFIVDRKKELIKYKGFQVPPAELESLLIKHPEIIDVGVIGIPDEESGELPAAFVVKKPGSKITAKEIENYVAVNVSSAKKLRGGVYFVSSIPKTDTGKILRRVLKEKAIKIKSKL